MNPMERLEFNKDSFTKSEQQIMKYIINTPLDVVQLSIIQMAEKSNTSKSAIIRFCQKIGYDGFSEFKFDFSRYLISNNQNLEDDTKKNSITAITSSYSDYINKISTTLTLDEITNLSKSMISSNRIKILGFNRTGFSASQLRFRLSKIGFDAEAITDQVLMRDTANTLLKNDLCIIFSITGSTSTYSDCIKTLKENKCKVILITMNPRTSLKSDCSSIISLPHISRSSNVKFLDDQVIFFVFIEILLSELANLIKKY